MDMYTHTADPCPCRQSLSQWQLSRSTADKQAKPHDRGWRGPWQRVRVRRKPRRPQGLPKPHCLQRRHRTARQQLICNACGLSVQAPSSQRGAGPALSQDTPCRQCLATAARQPSRRRCRPRPVTTITVGWWRSPHSPAAALSIPPPCACSTQSTHHIPSTLCPLPARQHAKRSTARP